MTTDTLREAASRAAREWYENHPDWQGRNLDVDIEMYILGYEAAKAEATRTLFVPAPPDDDGGIPDRDMDDEEDPCGDTGIGPCPGIIDDSGCGWCPNYKPNGGSHD